MSVILVFVLVLLGFAAWWLLQQRVTSKPWLEVGPDPVGGPGAIGPPTEKIALAVFLAVVGALFALFASAYFMRMEFPDWRSMPLPPIVWVNTVLLALGSVLLQCALVSARGGDRATTRLGIAGACLAALGFLAGQLAAWRELGATGFLVTGNPANSFFYLLTGLHGLHILVGLLALAWVVPLGWGRGAGEAAFWPNDAYRDREIEPAPWRGPDQLVPRLELCAMYWHVLLLIWLGLLMLFTGRAADIIAICRQILT
jgi:cytochrome c oxidase subunit 3